MANTLVSRVYDISIMGYADALKQLQALTAAFTKMDETKKRTDAALKTAIATGDTKAVEGLTLKVKELEKSLQDLDKTRERSAREVQLLASAEKLEAEAKLKSAQADKVKMESLISQDAELERQISLGERKLLQEDKKQKADEKELQRLIKLEEAERRRNAASGKTTATGPNIPISADTKAAEDSLNGLKVILKALEKEYGDLSKGSADFETKSKTLAESIKDTKTQISELTAVTKVQTEVNIIEAGSYRDIVAQQRELRAFVQSNSRTSTNTINFRGETLGIAEATEKFRQLSAAEGDFRRQFARDGLLVAEYSSGIVKAFGDLGLGDVFKKQRDDLNNSLNELKRQNRDLAEQYKVLAKSGGDAFDKISQDLRENIGLQEKMENSLKNLDSSLNATGSLGSTITRSFKEGFASAKTQLAQFALTYVGFQAAIGGVQKLVTVNFDFENASQELKAITGVTVQQLDFLKQKAKETGDTSRFSAVDTLTAFKLIGSAKPELLEDVEALNKIKDAAVLLAQASGTELPAAVDSLTKTLNQFGAGADQSVKFVDTLAAGAKFGAAEIPQISEALLDFGTQAKGANVSIAESTALIETLADKGIVGAEAGTKLRNVMLSLSAVEGLPKSALAGLDKFGVNTKLLSDATLRLKTV
jgi:hypothetical protein